MPIYKNKASQKIAVIAIDTSDGSLKTGDAGNITAQISKDGGGNAATNDANPTELDSTNHPGVYLFNMLQAETNADLIVLTASSSTGNISLGDPMLIYTHIATEDITLAELAQGQPSATPTLKDAIMLLFMALRNLTTTSSSLLEVNNDAGTVITKGTLNDDGSDFIKAKLVTGP